MRSRLSRNYEQKTKRNLIVTIVATFIILFVLVKFGIPALVNFSLFLGSFRSQPTIVAQKQNAIFITPPIFTSNFTATNSATVKITGTSSPKLTIKLFLNDSFLDSTTVHDDGTFSFDNVTLTTGQNVIKAKAQKDTSESDFSDPLSIAYSNKAPSLTIDAPSDGQSVGKDRNPLSIHGKTDPDIRVTVNDFWAITDSNGNYSYNLTLQGGDNQIKVVATDAAGNKTEKDIKVTLNQ